MEPEKDDFRIRGGGDDDDDDTPKRPGNVRFVFASAFLVVTVGLAALTYL